MYLENHKVFDAQVHTISKIFLYMLSRDRAKSYDPDFVKLCRKLYNKKELERMLRFIKHLFRLAQVDLKGKKILDVGCKFGLVSLIIDLLGAREVHAVDIVERYIDTFRSYLSDLKLGLSLYPKQGDAANLDYPDESFDVVLSIESISHYNDYNSFLSEAHRVLKKPGVLIISDGNNGSNLMIKRKTYKIWDVFENGPATVNIYGHPVKKAYLLMREEIIKEKFSYLDSEEIEKLAKGTSGMWGKQILDACQNYVEKGIEPQNFYKFGTCPVNSIYGNYTEFLFQPFKLANEIKSLGFDVRVYFSCSYGGIYRALNLMLKFIPRLTVFFYPSFKIIAWKK